MEHSLGVLHLAHPGPWVGVLRDPTKGIQAREEVQAAAEAEAAVAPPRPGRSGPPKLLGTSRWASQSPRADFPGHYVAELSAYL